MTKRQEAIFEIVPDDHLDQGCVHTEEELREYVGRGWDAAVAALRALPREKASNGAWADVLERA